MKKNVSYFCFNLRIFFNFYIKQLLELFPKIESPISEINSRAKK